MENKIKIITYSTQYQKAFKELNVEWISNYFEIEPTDLQALDYPEEAIINEGGEIFIAIVNDEVLGVCALIKGDTKDFDYELVKMAVSPKAQGRGLGLLLAESAIKWAGFRGATKLYLQSNTKLKAAIKLYEKIGFKEIKGISSPYKRVDIQMMLVIGQ